MKTIPIKLKLDVLLTEYNGVSNEQYRRLKEIRQLRGTKEPICFGLDDCSTGMLAQCAWSMDCYKGENK